MASKKAQMLEQALEKDMHPFAARMAAENPQLPPEPTVLEEQPSPTPQEADQTFDRPYARTSNVRNITRYAFEFFQDQVDTLKQWSLDEKQSGQKGSMSQMVREAMDMY